MNIALKKLEKELKSTESELVDAEKRRDRLYDDDSDLDCCQTEGSVAYFEGHRDGLESAIKAIKEEAIVDETLLEDE